MTAITAVTWVRLLRAEARKLTTTRMFWTFLLVLVLVAGLDAAVVAFGTDVDGSKGFVATAADQQSLMAFATNTTLGTGLFGAIAVAREHGHHTVIPTFLVSPKRWRAVLAQLTALLLAGAALGLVGQAFVSGGVALALPSTGYGFLVPAGTLIRLLAASALAGAVGAVFGAGLGLLIRNLGGAVAAVVFALFLVPPLVVQLLSGAASWIPATLFAVISGVSHEVGVGAAVTAVAGYALMTAAAGLVSVERRDVV